MGKGTSEAGGTVKAIGLDNKTIISIGKEGITVPVGILDGLQIGTDGKSYYVSDWNAEEYTHSRYFWNRLSRVI